MTEFGNRKKKRFNNAYISIKYKHGEDWDWSKAESWNEDGFSFLAEEEFALGEELEFKKSLNVFVGQIQWKQKEPDLETMFHMTVNKLIAAANELNPVVSEEELIRIIRSGDLAEKLEFARIKLGLNMSKENLKQEIANSGWDSSYCYGILCEDPKWKVLVEEVKEQLSDADILEQLKGQFDKLSDL